MKKAISRRKAIAFRKTEGIRLKAISNIGDRYGVQPEIRRLVSNAEIPIALRGNVIFGSRRKKMGRRRSDIRRKRKRSERKRKRGSALFACLGEEEKDP